MMMDPRVSRPGGHVERFRWTYGPMVRIFSHQHALSMRSTTCKQKLPGGLSVLTSSFDLVTQELIGSRDPSIPATFSARLAMAMLKLLCLGLVAVSAENVTQANTSNSSTVLSEGRETHTYKNILQK